MFENLEKVNTIIEEQGMSEDVELVRIGVEPALMNNEGLTRNYTVVLVYKGMRQNYLPKSFAHFNFYYLSEEQDSIKPYGDLVYVNI